MLPPYTTSIRLGMHALHDPERARAAQEHAERVSLWDLFANYGFTAPGACGTEIRGRLELVSPSF